MDATEELAPEVGTGAACLAMGVARATLYRRRKPPRPKTGERLKRRQPRSLDESERREVLDLLHSPRFVDKAPAAVYATLLDEGTYHCSIRTMYRILHNAREVRERRDQLRHPKYKKPELLATAPNQVWSWDITKLLGPAKWTYYYLYVILDIYSRYVVGWMLASRENADLAQRLIRDTIEKENVDADQLTIHSDRGPAMKSHTVAQLLATLGVTKSHSRPHVSNDNPFRVCSFPRRPPMQLASLPQPRSLAVLLHLGSSRVPPRCTRPVSSIGGFSFDLRRAPTRIEIESLQHH